MKVQPAAAEAFLRKPDPALRAVLVYGPDDGLVRERAARLVRGAVEDPDDPFLVTEMSGADLAGDPARLYDEAASLALTGGRRVVRLRDAGESAAPVLAEILSDSTTEAFIIVQAGNLGAKSALRKLFEGSLGAAALPCYADDAETVDRLIDDAMGAHGIAVAADARAWLVENLGSDRGVTRAELAKLALFAGSGGKVGLEDAEACIGDSALRTLETVALAAGGGDRAGLDRALMACLAGGINPVAILRAAAGHLVRLQWTAARMAGGMAPEAALQGLRPPVFFKNKKPFLHQARCWRVAALARALDTVLEAERLVKTTGMPSEAVCGRALLQVASLARKSGA